MKSLEIQRNSEKIQIDGKLDEGVWNKINSYTDFSPLGARSDVKTENVAQTVFKIFHDGESLFIGIKASEENTERLARQNLGRNTGAAFSQDILEVFLDPTGKGTTYYQFAVSSGNSRFSAYFIESGRISGGAYDPEWESAVFIGADFWSVEIKIPLYAFYKTHSRDFSSDWLINVARERYSQPIELTSWSLLTRSFHEPASFAKGKNFPLKSAFHDIRVESLTGLLTQMGQDFNTAELKANLWAGEKARKDYLIKLYIESGKNLSNIEVSAKDENTPILFKDLKLNAVGKMIFIFEVIDKHSQTIVQKQFIETRVEYEPLLISLSEPSYANCIFPDQDIREIKGKVTAKLSEKVLDNAQIKIELLRGDSVIYAINEKIVGNEFQFSIPSNTLENGNYHLSAEIQKDKNTAASGTIVIRKLPPLTEGTVVRIDEDKNLVVNGRKIFFRSWYGGVIWGVSQALREKYKGERPTPAINGWECIVDMQAERIDPNDSERKLLDVVPSEKVMQETRRRVEEARNNPSTWLYYLTDEPEYRPLSPVYLRHQYLLIKELDPYHPVLICSNEPAKYAGCADIIAPDPYTSPIITADGKRSMSSPKIIRKAMKDVVSVGTVAPWCIPQAFTYYFQDDQADYPNFTEYRCSVFTAVINGAKGIWPFIYCDHFNTPDLRLGCNYVFEELEGLDEWLLAPGKPAKAKIETEDEGVDVFVKTTDKATVLLAVNLLDKSNTAVISSNDLKNYTELVGYRSKELLEVKDSTVRIEFEPYEVKLFASKKIDHGMKTIEEFLAELDKARAELAKPGNILFSKGKEIEWSCEPQGSNVGSGNFKLLYTLCDGIEDNLGYISSGVSGTVTMAFPNFVPKFNKAILYSITVKDLDFYIWKEGDWKKIAEVRGHDGARTPIIEINFPEPHSTVKIKLDLLNSRPGFKAELNEIELYMK